MSMFPQAAIALAVTAVAVANTASAAQDSSGIAKGRALAERLCATCHMGPGQGEKTAPGEIPGFAAIARRPDQTIEGIVKWLRSIPPMMPNHHLSQDEMAALAAYILSLRGGDPS